MAASKWVVGLVGFFLTIWLAASWYVSDQFLSLGIVNSEEAEEREVLNGLNIPQLEKQAVEILSGEVVLSASFFEHPSPSACAVVLLPGIGGYRTQVLPALPVFWELGLTPTRRNSSLTRRTQHVRTSHWNGYRRGKTRRFHHWDKNSRALDTRS